MGARDEDPAKRSANLSINAGLLAKAKQLNINLSQTLEARLAQLVREAEAREWLEANRKAVDAYNRRIERDGIWSDKVRGF